MLGKLTKPTFNELHYLIALKILKGVGNATALKLINHFKSAKAVFQSSHSELKSTNLSSDVIRQILDFDLSLTLPIIEWSKQTNCNLLTLESPHYPPLLKEISSPPILLFTLGNLEILSTSQLAVVGSRNPTMQGLSNTQSLCQAIAEQGLTITSGLADGIDGEAHRTALAANGYTIAVTGTGLNRVYPAKHRELAHLIANKGLLISENLPDEPINPGSFPQRNRIIAGISLGTLVIEATIKSGSLITAKHALNEGREVYAVPGSIHNPQAKGCHKLIKEGAKLVESIEDIIEDLPSISRAQINRSFETINNKISSDDAEFLKFLDYDLTSIDTIVFRSQLTVEEVINKLLLLELDGWVISSAGGYLRQ